MEIYLKRKREREYENSLKENTMWRTDGYENHVEKAKRLFTMDSARAEIQRAREAVSAKETVQKSKTDRER